MTHCILCNLCQTRAVVPANDIALYAGIQEDDVKSVVWIVVIVLLSSAEKMISQRMSFNIVGGD